MKTLFTIIITAFLMECLLIWIADDNMNKRDAYDRSRPDSIRLTLKQYMDKFNVGYASGYIAAQKMAEQAYILDSAGYRYIVIKWSNYTKDRKADSIKHVKSDFIPSTHLFK